MRLSVNVDHVATIRQARMADEPDPVWAAAQAELAGACGITVHLRGDRRHIQDADVEAINADSELPMNLEMASHPEIVQIALQLAPEEVCLVPEKREELTTEAGPITYKSEALARELGLSNLYIGFSGYWPEKEAFIRTCSFKELEAHPTMQFLKETGGKAIVLASAGNTGRAFAHVSALTGTDVYIVVPESTTRQYGQSVRSSCSSM